MYIGKKGVFGGNVKLVGVNEIYKLSVNVYYISGGQITET
jgi:hypothetical protein